MMASRAYSIHSLCTVSYKQLMQTDECSLEWTYMMTLVISPKRNNHRLILEVKGKKLSYRYYSCKENRTNPWFGKLWVMDRFNLPTPGMVLLGSWQFLQLSKDYTPCFASFTHRNLRVITSWMNGNSLV